VFESVDKKDKSSRRSAVTVLGLAVDCSRVVVVVHNWRRNAEVVNGTCLHALCSFSRLSLDQRCLAGVWKIGNSAVLTAILVKKYRNGFKGYKVDYKFNTLDIWVTSVS